MITEIERSIIKSFDDLLRVNTIDAKLQLYKNINSSLDSCVDNNCDDFNFKNYCKQFLYDLTNFYSYGMFFEIVKCIDLLTLKMVGKRYNLKTPPEREILVKVIDCFKLAITNNSRFNNEKEFFERFCHLMMDRKTPIDILLKAENEIYFVANTVFKSKIKELYSITLTLLCKLEKNRPPNAVYILNDSPEKMNLWFQYLLPLMFEVTDVTDDKILKDIITAFETFTLLVAPNLNYRNHEFWNETKNNIIDIYSVKLNEMRGTVANWYRIWNVLVRIVNKEILKSASIINKFLSIVELGFRNDNFKIRSQAYICWKNLIEIFAMNNELTVSKRIKLVCIPFKTAKPRTVDIAITKFKAWWFLLIQLNQQILEHLNTIFFPFLEHAFGKISDIPLESYLNSNNTEQNSSISKLYVSIRSMSIVALICLISEPGKFIDVLRQRHDMDNLIKPIDFSSVFDKVGKQLISYCFEATVLTSHLQNQTEICTILWTGLLHQARILNSYDDFDLMMKNIKSLIEVSKLTSNINLSKLIPEILMLIMNSNLSPFKKTNNQYNYEELSRGVKYFIRILLHKDLMYFYQLTKCIQIIFEKLDHSAVTSEIVNYLTLSCDEFKGNGILKLEMWNALHAPVIKMIEDTNEETNTEDMVNSTTYYLDWLLKNSKEYDIASASSNSSLYNWAKVYKAMCCRPLYKSCTIKLFKTLHEGIEKNCKDGLIIYIDCLNTILENNKLLFGDIELLSEPVTMMEQIYTQFSDTIINKNYATIFKGFNNYIKMLDKINLIRIAKPLKTVLKTVQKKSETNTIIHPYFITLKKNIQEKYPDKQNSFENNNNLKIIFEICEIGIVPNPNQEKSKCNDFVVIPSVWKLRPEKLTEHQIEKMKERKTDIPALYNDMTESQESVSIKPWTLTKMANGTVDHNIVVVRDSPERTDIIVDKENNITPNNFSFDGISKIVENDKYNFKNTTPKSTSTNITSTFNEISNEIIDSSQGSSPITSRASRRKSAINSTKQADKSKTAIEIEPISTIDLDKLNTEEAPTPVTINRTEKEGNNLETNDLDKSINSTMMKIFKNIIITGEPQQPVFQWSKPVVEKQNPPTLPETVVKDKEKKNSLIKSETNSSKVITIETDNKTEEVGVELEPDSDKLIARRFHNLLTEENDAQKDKLDESMDVEIVSDSRNAAEFKTSPKTGFKVDEIIDCDADLLNNSLLNESIDDRHTTNKSIRSSPDLSDTEQRQQDLINSTLDLSPILNDNLTPKSTPKNSPISSPSTKFKQMDRLTTDSPFLSSPVGLKKTPFRATPRSEFYSSQIKSTFSSSSPHSLTKNKFQANRGKHLMDLIRKKQNLTHQALLSSPDYRKKEESETPITNKLLTFSSKLPPSDASPSISILKRKFNDDSGNEGESPMHKRKRVSFHDPPVSATKEYVTDDEGKVKIPVKRCLIASPLQKLLSNSLQPETDTNLRDDEAIINNCSTISMDTLRDVSSISSDSEDDISITPSPPSISFTSEDAILQHIFEKYSPEEYKEKFIESGKQIGDCSTKTIVKELKTVMQNNEKSKREILDCLSENYSTDFLQHALQENSTSAVCDLLSYIDLLDYVLNKGFNKNECKNDFLKKIIENSTTIFNSFDNKFILNFIKTKLTNDVEFQTELFSLIENLYEIENDKLNCSTSYNSTTSTSTSGEMNKLLFEHLLKLFSNKLSKNQIFECLRDKLL